MSSEFNHREAKVHVELHRINPSPAQVWFAQNGIRLRCLPLYSGDGEISFGY